MDKGYDNPTGHQAVAAHGYRGHIRQIGEEKLDAKGEKCYPARRWVVERTLAWLSMYSVDVYLQVRRAVMVEGGQTASWCGYWLRGALTLTRGTISAITVWCSDSTPLAPMAKNTRPGEGLSHTIQRTRG